MIRRDRNAVSILAVVAGALAAFPTLAQTTPDSGVKVEEIVVTAQKRQENIQKIPVAVTAITGKTLEARGITDTLSLAQATSGLQLNPGTSGVVLPYLRGVGTSASNLGRESSVAVYADGVYFTRLPVGFFSLNDIERVEVLKGPQDTLFGRNSSAGVIQIITRDPSHTASVKGSVSYGAYDTVEASVYGTTGLTDKIAMDLAAYVRNQGEGYGINIPTGNSANYTDNVTVRSKLLFEPGVDTRVTLAGYFTHTKVGQQGNTYPGTIAGYSSTPYAPLPPIGFYDQRNDIDSYVNSDSWGTSLKIQQDLHFVRITSISAYTKEAESLADDGDYTPRADFLFVADGYVKQFTQELQLAAPQDSRLKWIAGAYYYNALTRYTKAQLSSPSGGLADVYGPGLNLYGVTQSKSIAGYAQATYEILPKLSLTGGLRYTDDHTSANGSIDLNTIPPLTIYAPGPAELITHKLTYKAALDYQLTSTVMGYASISRGFKSGGFNLVSYDPIPAKPEILDAYEFGVKSDLLDRKLRLNISAFLYNIANPQVQLQSGTSVIVSNAGSARVKGAEVELDAAVAQGFNAHFSATYLDSRYTSYGTLNAQGNVINGAPSGPQNFNPPFGAISPLEAVIATGNYTPQAPTLTLDAGLDYTINTSRGDVTLTADYYYNDGFYWEPDNFLKQKAYGLLNARARFHPGGNFAVSLWGKNLVGEEYATQAVTQAGPAGYPYLAAPPRTYGITLDFDF